jgi:hypothetical protein
MLLQVEQQRCTAQQAQVLHQVPLLPNWLGRLALPLQFLQGMTGLLLQLLLLAAP